MSVTTPTASAPPPTFVAPHPGTPKMPQWDTGELPEPPRFTWRNWALLGRPRIGDGRRSDRRRRVDHRSRGNSSLRRCADVAGDVEHSVPGRLQHGDQPLHALLRRADLHRQVPPATQPALLAGRLSDSRFRLVCSVPRGQRRHAAGGDAPWPHPQPRTARRQSSFSASP